MKDWSRDYGFDRIEPREVVLPGTAEEVSSIVSAASSRTIGIRGAGYSVAGQASSGDLLIATENLNRILEITKHSVKVECGVTWRTLLESLPANLYPPVVPSIEATIGGTLSTGGIGRGSIEHGYVIDNVLALTVVTVEGRIVELAPGDALFNAVLGGYGLFGLIVNATLALVQRAETIRIEKQPFDGTWPQAAFHATVFPDGQQIRVYENGDIPLGEWLLAPRPLPKPPLRITQILGVIDGAQLHPIRQRERAHGLLLPRVPGELAIASTLFERREGGVQTFLGGLPSLIDLGLPTFRRS